MQESKIHATERLRREGRWDEASAFRDQERQRLKAEGLNKTESSQKAWNAMIEAYPPLAAGPSTAKGNGGDVDEAAAAALAARVGDQPADLIRDVLWTYENLDRAAAGVASAPSLGAWSMLKWARDSRNRFFEQMLPKALAAREKESAIKDESLDDPGVEEIQQILRELRRSAAEAAGD